MTTTHAGHHAPSLGRSIGLLVLSLALCFAAGAIGSAATLPSIPTWYEGLQKPWFTPPNWVFGPVWSVLYVAMALVLWRLFLAEPSREKRAAILVYLVQLALNALWSVAFFGFTSALAGLVVIVPLWLSIVWSIVTARPVVGRWTLLLVPYLAWVSYATALNVGIFALNG